MLRNQVLNFLDQTQIPYRLIEHKAVFTVAESSDILDDNVPTKCLLLEDSKNHSKYLIAMRGEARLDLKSLATKLQANRLQFVKPDEVERIVGVKPGSVSIFGLLNTDSGDITAIVDKSLLNEPELGFHPNDNTATVFINPDKIATVLEKMNHNYIILML